MAKYFYLKMKLNTRIAPEEVDKWARQLLAEINAQHDNTPIDKKYKEYFSARIREDMETAMNVAFSAGRCFERRNPIEA